MKDDRKIKDNLNQKIMVNAFNDLRYKILTSTHYGSFGISNELLSQPIRRLKNVLKKKTTT